MDKCNNVCCAKRKSQHIHSWCEDKNLDQVKACPERQAYDMLLKAGLDNARKLKEVLKGMGD